MASALDVLRQIKLNRRAEAPVKVIEWGDLDSIFKTGIENLTRTELKNHLEARDLDTSGTRLELVERLRSSLNDEQLHKFAYSDTLNAEELLEAHKEEKGSVYVVGSNNRGQLGVGDFEPRTNFVVVKQLRGIGVCYVYAGADMSYAITENHDVFVWGGGGVGKTGIALQPVKKSKKATKNWLEPQQVREFTGEECEEVVVGSSHCVARGKSGDCFVWGDGDSGQLGLGDFQHREQVAINNSFSAARQVACGSNHTTVLTKTGGQVYTWGHLGNGRLGIGMTERVGVPEKERYFLPLPQRVMQLEAISTLSCGVDHTLAIGRSGVWAWGSGAGGKLGLGDNTDRPSPNLVHRLRGKALLQVSAGSWHSLALVAFPPMMGGGWVYSWGTGLMGQLGRGKDLFSPLPEVVEFFPRVRILLRAIDAGSHHCAAVSTDGELYTWGSNAHGCLGRKLDVSEFGHAFTPGHCGGFGAIVGKIGRGMVRAVSCGTEFTVVATNTYTGPSMEAAIKLDQEATARGEDALTLAVGRDM